MPIFEFFKTMFSLSRKAYLLCERAKIFFFSIYFQELLHGNTGFYKGLQGVTRAYKGLQGVTRDYRASNRLKGFTGG